MGFGIVGAGEGWVAWGGLPAFGRRKVGISNFGKPDWLRFGARGWAEEVWNSELLARGRVGGLGPVTRAFSRGVGIVLA